MPTPFQSTLLPGSYRGIPFVTEENGGEVGRRGMVHEYWGSNTPYSEDGGKRARRIEFRCFVLGDDCALQRDLLLSALEQPGAGLLIHPSMGIFMMQPDPLRPCRFHEIWSQNRRIEFELAFVEPGQLVYPTAGADTQAQSAGAGEDLQGAADQDFSGGVQNTASADDQDFSGGISGSGQGNQDFSGGTSGTPSPNPAATVATQNEAASLYGGGDEAGGVPITPPDTSGADEAGKVVPPPPDRSTPAPLLRTPQAGDGATRPPLSFSIAPGQD